MSSRPPHRGGGIVVFTVVTALAFAERAEASCAAPSHDADLEHALATAESAYVALDGETFDASMTRASTVLPCLAEALTPTLAAHYHRLEALRRYAILDEQGAGEAVRAARVVDPGYTFSDEVLPPDHPLRQQYTAASTSDSVTSPSPRPLDGALLFDGRATVRRPGNRATVFQFVDDAGIPTTTVYLLSKDPLPSYPTGQNAEAAAGGSAVRTALFGVGGASLLASGALYGLAWSTHKPFFDTSDNDITLDELKTLQKRSRTWTALSGVTLGIAVGAAGTGLVVGS